jgi:hypothetical protein
MMSDARGTVVKDFIFVLSLCVLVFLPMCRRTGWRFCSLILNLRCFILFCFDLCDGP